MVMVVQFGTSIGGGKRPSDTDGLAVALLSPSQGVLLKGSTRFITLVGTLTSQGREFDLDHVEPTGMFGCVMELQAPKDAMRLGRREGFI